MRLVRVFIAVIKQAGACGVGVYLGAVVVGLVAVLSGHIEYGRGWLATVPVLLLVGPLLGFAVGWTSRHWLVPSLQRRRWCFAIAGAVSLPLFTAFGAASAMQPVGVPIALLGGVITAFLYWRASRLSRAAALASLVRVLSR